MGGALLLAGCASGGGDANPGATATADGGVPVADPSESATSPTQEADLDTGYTVCGDYFEAQLSAASALNPQVVDAAAASIVSGVALPTAGCAMQITLGNGATQLSLGWDSADVEALHQQLLAGGFTDVSPFANASGSSYVMTHPGSNASLTLWSGDRVYSEVDPTGVYLGYSV